MFAIAILSIPLPFAQEVPEKSLAEEPWHFDAFIYYWSAGIDGDMTVDGQEIDLPGGGGDGVSPETSLSGFLGQFEASRGPWTFAVAPMFVSVKSEGDGTGSTDADVEIDAQIHEGFVAHDFGGSFQWLLGARYYELETEADLSVGGVPAGSVDNIHAWVDPIVGVRYLGSLGADWDLRCRADVGGFGLGSDFAWNASALVGYRFSSTIGAYLGYRALSIDLADGGGSDRVEYNLTMYGPILGLSLWF